MLLIIFLCLPVWHYLIIKLVNVDKIFLNIRFHLYVSQVTVTDTGGLWTRTMIVVTVDDQNEAPQFGMAEYRKRVPDVAAGIPLFRYSIRVSLTDVKKLWRQPEPI